MKDSNCKIVNALVGVANETLDTGISGSNAKGAKPAYDDGWKKGDDSIGTRHGRPLEGPR